MSPAKRSKRPVTGRPSEDLSAPAWYRREAFHYALLFGGALLLYGRTTGFGYNLDDDYIVSFLSAVGRDLSGISEIFGSWFGGSDYRPVTILSFWLERQLAGSWNASVSHGVNVILYGLVLIAIYRFILSAEMIPDRRQAMLLALLTGFLFLAHPNHVSVVANIKSRDNLLSMLFGLLAARQLIFAYDRRQVFRVLLFLPLIVAALLSKRDSYAFILLPALVILFFRPGNRRAIALAMLLTAGLYIAAFSLYAVFSSLPDPGLSRYSMTLADNPLAEGSTFLQRLSLALTTLFYYYRFLLLPWGYHFYFGYDQIPLSGLFSLPNIAAVLISLFFLGYALFRFKQERIYLFCLFAFALSIGYALNFFSTVAGIVMDRYNFIPSLFFCLALASIFLQGINGNFRKAFRIALGLLLLLWAGATFVRTADWKNHYTLFARDLPKLERSANAHRLAAGTYIHTALIEETRPNFNRQLTDSFISLGEGYIKRSLAIYDRSAPAWELYGLCDLYYHRDSLAQEKFRRSAQLDTTYYSGINYLGFTFWNLMQIDSAIYYFSYVADREARFNYSANNLVDLYLKNARRNEADSLVRLLYRRFPEDKRLLRKISEIGTTIP